jgi:hypothetical protein
MTSLRFHLVTFASCYTLLITSARTTKPPFPLTDLTVFLTSLSDTHLIYPDPTLTSLLRTESWSSFEQLKFNQYSAEIIICPGDATGYAWLVCPVP